MTADETFLARSRELAEQYGTPTYVYDGRIVKSKIESLRSAFASLDHRLLYAMKANPLPALLRLMQSEGVGVDVVSPGELDLALRLGFSPSNILFSANNMTDREMEFAVSRGVMINIGELGRLDRYGRRNPGSRVSLRINPQYGSGHHSYVVTAGRQSKFGIPAGDLEQAIRIASNYDLRIVGLHQHIGSGNLDVEPYRKAVAVIFDAATDFPNLEFVNIGGGIGVAYEPKDQPFDLEGLRDVVAGELGRLTSSTGIQIEVWLEPGRYLVAEAGVLLIEVNTIKRSYGQTFLGTNSGMSQLIRPAIYGAFHGVENISNPSGERHTYHVVGNICESSDFFARERELSDVREGDVLAILDVGAYGIAMASEYNLRPLPAEVYVDPDGTARLVRKRETPTELVDRLMARNHID